ncbi:hypothetical protein P171DRAFT_241063 [Karstenula rhodostoma CBS 690.94]|uniref:Uncharacterized protein n=1 Tax=Karstenula rhodostoma CBS 690.94 TaxID=1392251 RepID=A0A9P4PQ15_9PLEO|nr:hypothetical protein P171DRAFT_241063 [Karstenula rhodostoma CBS 690.94]
MSPAWSAMRRAGGAPPAAVPAAGDHARPSPQKRALARGWRGARTFTTTWHSPCQPCPDTEATHPDRPLASRCCAPSVTLTINHPRPRPRRHHHHHRHVHHYALCCCWLSLRAFASSHPSTAAIPRRARGKASSGPPAMSMSLQSSQHGLAGSPSAPKSRVPAWCPRASISRQEALRTTLAKCTRRASPIDPLRLSCRALDTPALLVSLRRYLACRTSLRTCCMHRSGASICAQPVPASLQTQMRPKTSFHLF